LSVAVNILGPSIQREAECEDVLRTLPMWFGIEDALLEVFPTLWNPRNPALQLVKVLNAG
jgi:hypothetical protein